LEKPVTLSDGPLPIPKNWTQLVGRKLAVADQDRISNSIRRGAPLGNPDWVKRAATELNLQSTIKPRGRPSMTALCVVKTGGLCSCLAFSAVVGRSVPFLVVRVDG